VEVVEAAAVEKIRDICGDRVVRLLEFLVERGLPAALSLDQAPIRAIDLLGCEHQFVVRVRDQSCGVPVRIGLDADLRSLGRAMVKQDPRASAQADEELKILVDDAPEELQCGDDVALAGPVVALAGPVCADQEVQWTQCDSGGPDRCNPRSSPN
jgi:hypothetical protein